MLRLAMTTRSETFERVRDPLAERGIEVVHLRAKGRTIRLTGSPDAPADPVDPAPETVDVGFVYPTRLMEGAALDARLGVPWVNDRDAVLTSRNKGGVTSALDAAGIPVPRSVMVSNPVNEATIHEAVADAGLSYPLVIKPNSTTRGVGVAKAVDPDDLSGTIDYLDLVHDFRATGDKSYLIQEFLPDARDHRLMVVDGDCLGAVERRLPGAEADDDDTEGGGHAGTEGGSGEHAGGRWKHNVHRGASAVPVDPPDRHRELAERTAATLGIDYLGVDLLETDDRLVVTETNARPTIDAAEKYEATFYDRLAALIRRTAEE
ncbi:ATP-grasp domain-containing protein [Halopenitus persicus]|uniref:SSU ribosomal protein S6P modification protein n=1 Tax=Halopenitus persicus TaxID=1048396 RepID=A0A1H3FS67_9EURY|nr:RimK family alpha-L-glutamate ligase [Halopenitus persicus]SDX93004.1 SSU ribosomal protein S6P modification protein [Halopenitus persicus]